jgi:hypothetical protein
VKSEGQIDMKLTAWFSVSNRSARPLSERAQELLTSLPDRGTVEDRLVSARTAVDTLVREYGDEPAIAAARLARTMARKAPLATESDTSLRMGLRACAGGIAPTGNALADLALTILDAMPSEDTGRMAEAAVSELRRRDDSKAVLALRDTVRRSPRATHTRVADRALLEGVKAQTDSEQTALRLYDAMGHDVDEGQMIGTLRSQSQGDARRTWDMAKSLYNRSWFSGNKGWIVNAFLKPLDHTVAGRAQRLADGREWLGRGYLHAVSELMDEARAKGDPSWKYMQIGKGCYDFWQIAGKGHEQGHVLLQEALQRVAAGPVDDSGPGLCNFAGELLDHVSYADNYGSVYKNFFQDSLVECAPDQEWRTTFMALGSVAHADANDALHGFNYFIPTILKRLGTVQPGQSPLLTMCHEAAKWTGKSWEGTTLEGFKHILAAAENLAREPKDVTHLAQAREILRQKGLADTVDYLAKSL